MYQEINVINPVTLVIAVAEKGSYLQTNVCSGIITNEYIYIYTYTYTNIHVCVGMCRTIIVIYVVSCTWYRYVAIEDVGTSHCRPQREDEVGQRVQAG